MVVMVNIIRNKRKDDPMNNQLTFSDIERNAVKITKREQFLSDMETVVPWEKRLGLIAPFYPDTEGERGRRLYRLYGRLLDRHNLYRGKRRRKPISDVKQQRIGFRKTRYKGERKNAALMHILYASVNLVKLSRLTKGVVCQKA